MVRQTFRALSVQILLIASVTGGTLALLSLLKVGYIRFDNIANFWSSLLFFAISVLAAHWVLLDCQRRAVPHAYLWSFTTLILWAVTLPIYILYRFWLSRSMVPVRKQQSGRNFPSEIYTSGFQKVIGAYAAISIAVAVLLVGFVIFYTLSSSRGKVPQEQSDTQQTPPSSLTVGGLGNDTVYLFDVILPIVPERYRYRRTDSRGYKIHVPIIQETSSRQYPEVVIENPGGWIGLYKLRGLFK